ncbi:MAG TPA: 23S rRNA (pseudouridine(1915)-N(3))-methyltransferase RlmH [Fervidobacterium sp.]|nr:50S rRNA methyltransferase [Fervidobacterium sp.]HOK87483.1 23S rRNA (pseudouridine(1915)-N(3))-methyltransferase RlmH [Fervidobacterium sp.]HOM73887.1 23S rRNA (pseudouridine(1915)-N(3))-methyltransferase RlmH [Fervidobacterium sp.]HOQ39174.1 23S rRNA (pseudouridine(1915)-N(3))-methyltransferase RlmH [Fervidobacterium sp.]HPP17618.1 23S rRNA (pseudouridine(1915)-N(3))-methyltransferase RlmH [Fervidobacterium sp.]
MRIEIIVPGKISMHLLPAYEYYMEKLKRFARVNISHVNLGGDLNTEDATSILRKEADYIERKVDNRKYILIDLSGKELTSNEFLNILENQFLNSSEMLFVIGGPLGIDERIRKNAIQRISLSKLTFTHEMCIILLLEQIFRSFKTMRNEKYHY